MRTTKEENIAAAKFIASKLNQSTAPVCLLLPEKGAGNNGNASQTCGLETQVHQPRSTFHSQTAFDYQGLNVVCSTLADVVGRITLLFVECLSV